MVKVVLGFPPSHETIMRYAELKGIKLYPFLTKIQKKHLAKTVEEYLEKNSFFVRYSTIPDSKKKDENDGYWTILRVDRSDELLVKAVEDIGKDSGCRIVDVPDDVDWFVTETDDGHEYIAEEHETWS